MDYRFDDLYSYRFMFDSEKKQISISFDSYYTNDSDELKENKCSLIIKEWTLAKGKLSQEKHFTQIEKYIGVVDMILSMKQKNNIDKSILTMTVMLIDERYVDWYFENPKIEFVED